MFYDELIQPRKLFYTLARLETIKKYLAMYSSFWTKIIIEKNIIFFNANNTTCSLIYLKRIIKH